ncbi:PAS domain-containing sensor histidine kinase [Mucilaginibacter sp.]|uniref:PAS domain-containing sensor histidine kinase n=1 Tax=Mucilaginibacter sp. TaxID=1882438 RepID=UPI002614466E|nr:PAS domain-containing sensor histidine kinase [Mucilaginibacter sp.]MDB4926832.1 cph1 7 [Mucilaginibacter sp.]
MKTIMEFGIDTPISENNKIQHDNIYHFTQIINNISTGIWEYNVTTKEVKWSAGFYTILGYETGEIECSYDFFLEHLVYHDDRKVLLKPETAPLHIRLLTKNAGYQWFDINIKKYDNGPAYLRYGLITNIHQYKIAAIKAQQNELFFIETAKIAKVGGWMIDAYTRSPTLLKETYDIYELHNKPPLTIDEFISFFEPSYRANLVEAIDNTIRYCRSFDMELLFRSAKNNAGWLRCKGIPIINTHGECTEIRGIFQKIIGHKKQEIVLRNSLRLLEDQNKRLQNFAYIVSHNLRSYSGNLKSMVNLHGEVKESEQAEIFSHIRAISESLSETVEHLDEIVKIQVETIKEKKTVELEPVFKNIVEVLDTNIHSCNAQIEYDFSECPIIDYIPAYLESIFQNLLTNSLKYRDPVKRPVINCRTYKDGDHVYLTFQDNGLGIDLQRHGDSIFGMYKTFHENNDAKGIGLFITRNQVESLGGSIKIDSAVNIGTKFTIRLV